MFDLVSYGALAPPAVLVLLALIGALLALRWRRLGLTIVLLSSLFLYLLSTSAVSSWLMQQAEAGVANDPDFSGAQAIVVLSGDVRLGAEGEPDSLGPYTVERIFYAAQAYRRLHLPIAVSGGPAERSHATAGDLMKAALERDFGISVSWNDNRAATTWENAVDTKPLLDAAKVTTVVLVTHAWHMRRALWCFERVGLRALPWPAPRSALRIERLVDYLPRSGALPDSFFALHELIGSLYYRIRH